MTKWTTMEPPRKPPPEPPDPHQSVVTDDPLAALGFDDHGPKKKQVYAVSRVNPLFQLSESSRQVTSKDKSRQQSPSAGAKSGSSGYGGSHDENATEQIYVDLLKLVEETGTVVEQNPVFVKSIRVANSRGLRSTKSSVPSQNSSSSGGGTLTTIPEGKVDLPIPQPIWPMDELKRFNRYDSLVDDALLLYTSLNYVPESIKCNRSDNCFDLSVKDLLVDLLASINHTLENKTGNAEDVLKAINEKIASKLDALRNTTEEEMKRLCLNLSNSKNVTSVIRAFSHSSSSGRSSSSCHGRSSTSNDDDIYHIPSNSSSSGFSDSPTGNRRLSNHLLPPSGSVFCHDARGVRNALIYGTTCRNKRTPPSGKAGINDDVVLSDSAGGTFSKDAKCDVGVVLVPTGNENKLTTTTTPKRGGLLNAESNDKPSVWELYYGMKAEGVTEYGRGKPSDVPVYPIGRPEADFTLDLPRSEMLCKKMKEDKKWRCRCRLLTSFLGFVFFLLSVMAVSLILTKGRRMFGSMV